MPAVPWFFIQPKIFQVSIYRRLRARILNERLGSGSFRVTFLSQIKDSSSLSNENPRPPDENYLELQELPTTYTVAERSLVFGGENGSGMAIAKMTTLDMIFGPK